MTSCLLDRMMASPGSPDLMSLDRELFAYEVPGKFIKIKISDVEL